MGKEFINGRYIINFTDEEKEKIVHWFVDDGLSMRKICSFFDIAKSKSIAKVLDEYNIDHSRGNISAYKYNYPEDIYDEEYEREIVNIIASIPYSNNQKYDINQYYFDDLRDPQVIYTIGFLYADGCNHNENYVTMSLEECDYNILKTINNNLNNELDVKFCDKSNKHDFGYSYKNQYQVSFYNKRIAKVLSVLGVVPRKSLILEFPKWLHPSMYSSFIRGVYDGDGSVYRYFDKNGKPKNTTVTITSTEKFCKAINDICAKYIGINSNIYDASCHNGITKVFSITGYSVCKKFLDWIYNDSTIHLERKFLRYCEYYNLDKSIVA